MIVNAIFYETICLRFHMNRKVKIIKYVAYFKIILAIKHTSWKIIEKFLRYNFRLKFPRDVLISSYCSVIPKSIWSAANKTQMFGSTSSRRTTTEIIYLFSARAMIEWPKQNSISVNRN